MEQFLDWQNIAGDFFDVLRMSIVFLKSVIIFRLGMFCKNKVVNKEESMEATHQDQTEDIVMDEVEEEVHHDTDLTNFLL